MPNPGGGNQFGNYQLQPAYGDVAKQTQLTQAAPMSGAPYAAQALNAPRRSQRAATSGQASQGQPSMPEEQATLPPSRVYQQIAAIPGASDTVREIFGG